MTSAASQRLPGLDLLRLVAALMVVAYHFGFRMAMTGEGGEVAFPEVLPWAMWGDTGVMVFFAISGYVIALSAENRTAYDFAVNRLVRLWPALIVSASLSALVLWMLPLPGHAPPSLGQLLAQFTFVPRVFGHPFIDGVYWSIVYELVFYGWVTLLLATGIYHLRLNNILAIWIIVSVLNEGLLGSSVLRIMLLTDYSGYFAFGILLYRSEQGMDRRLMALLVLTMAHILLSRLQFETYIVRTYHFQRDAGGVAIAGPLAVIAVVIATSVRHVPLLGRYTVALGALTYPLYLLHQNIGYTVFNHFGTMHNRWLLGFALVGLLLAASWRIAMQVEPVARRLMIAAAHRLRRGVLGRRNAVVPGE